MKLFVMADMEGISGIHLMSQVKKGRSGSADWEGKALQAPITSGFGVDFLSL